MTNSNLSKGLEEGYSSLTKIFRSATGEQAHRWLTLKCEPYSATWRVAEGRSRASNCGKKIKDTHKECPYFLAQEEGFEPPWLLA